MGKKNRVKFRDSTATQSIPKAMSIIDLAKNFKIKNKAPVEILFFLAVFALPMSIWSHFYTDWTNHVWLISHFRTEFLAGNLLPDFIHVEGAKFESMPFYYGTYFYPLAAIVSVPFGANLTVKLAVLGLAALLFMRTFRLFILLGKSQKYSAWISILFSTSVYSATNLYNRSALTEFFSNILLSIGVIYAFSALVQNKDLKAFKSNVVSGLFFITLSLGTHPIVTFTSTIFIFPALLIFISSRWKTLETAAKKNLLAFSAAALGILAPIYGMIIKYRNEFPIGNGTALQTFPDSIDSPWARLGIFYIDSRAFDVPINEIGTPFLNAPLGIPIVFMFLFLSVGFLKQKKKNPLEVLSIGMILFSTFVLASSLIVLPLLPPNSHGPLAELSKLLAPIQFLYRLSGTLHLLMVVGIVILSLTTNSDDRKAEYQIKLGSMVARAMSSLAILALGFHICLTFFEYSKINGVGGLSGDSNYKSMVSNTGQFPPTFYGMRQFNMENGLTEIRAPGIETTLIAVEPNGKTSFVCNSDECTIKTDVFPTKLISVGLDGYFANPQSLLDKNVSFTSSRGTHFISVRIEDNLVYAIRLAFYLLLFWLLYLLSQSISRRLIFNALEASAR